MSVRFLVRSNNMGENPKLHILRKKSMKLPLRPGVYIMKDSTNKIIYIGKAKALKNRVSQYFGSQEGHNRKVRKMVENVNDFDYIITDSEYEALVLECNLIKLHKPHYNILLKDDKGYHYIRISNEMYPRITAAKQIADDGAVYLGPYTSANAVKQSIDEALRVFRLPSCRRKFPQEIGKGRPCLNYSIKQCMGLCRGRIKPEEYREALDDAIDFLRGGTTESIKRLNDRMEQYAEDLEFEKAAKVRDRITALRRMSERQKVVMTKAPEQDVFALALSGSEACAVVFRFMGGRLVDSEPFMLGEIASAEYARSQLILQFYAIRERIPPRILLDGEADDLELLERMLTEQAGRKVTIMLPQKGESHQIVEMCRQNAAEHLANPRGRQGSHTAAADELARLLGLSRAPEYIESYDISNTAGENNVAGMVVFENGLPLKSAYRKFKIRTVSGQDDYGSMREVICRRIDEYHQHKDEGTGFGRLPDLILLDGGQGHVAAIKPLIEASGLDIPVFGMVKDDKHRTRAISADGGEIAISGTRAAFTLVSTIQEEVHRFAITFHRSSRSKGMKGLSLTRIEGIGETRARELIKHFKTITAIKNASVEELAAVKGMNSAAAQRVYDFYRSEDN